MDVSQTSNEEEEYFFGVLLALGSELSSDGADFCDVMQNDVCPHTFIAYNCPPFSTNEHVTRPLAVVAKSSRYRNRRREELELLRNTVKTLEARLAALKVRPRDPSESGRQIPCSQSWEALALKEYWQRQQAESENKELRETVEMYVQLAQKLDQVLKRVIADMNTMETT